MSESISVSRLLGFHEAYLARMDDPTQRKWLMRINLAVSFGLCLMALSVGLLVWMLAPRNWEGGLWAVGATAASAILLAKLHALLITLGAVPLERPPSAIDQWRPSRLRILAFAALALVMSQPLLLWTQENRLQEAAMERARFSTTVQFEARERARLVDRQQALLVQRSVLSDERQRVTASMATTAAKAAVTFVGSPRKAMLVGASNYTTKPLPNVANDIVAMERKLRSMGYAVLVSMDDSRTEVRRKLESYSASLRSGDISLIYFSGHGIENSGHNYFIPRDFRLLGNEPLTRQMLQDHAIAITPYIDELTRERLRLHLLLLDACRTDLEGKPRGLAQMQSMASRNVIVAMAASAGQEALDGLVGQKGGNSPYTTALLRNLDRDEDVGRVLRRVNREVVESTTATKRLFHLPPQTPVVVDSAGDLDIKLLAPALERKSQPNAQAMAKVLPPMCNSNYERTGNAAGLGACLDQEISALTRQVEFLEGQLSAQVGQESRPMDGLLDRAVFFAERSRLMWEDYFLSFVGTLGLVALMIAGLVIRDLLRPQALRSYERIRHREQRILLHEDHDQNQSMIENLAAPLRAQERLPRFEHWSKKEDFFTTALTRPALKGGIDTSLDQTAATQMWAWLQNPMPTKDQL